MIWPVTETAATLALDRKETGDFEDCLALLAELTPRLTAEFAIRRLLAADLDRALAVIQGWTSHPDWQVRRLASEGTRAYLPWAIRVPEITDRPAATLPILDALYRDPVEDVRRSVANHLNDLARHAPDEVVATAARWLAAPDGNTPRVVRHGLRTLVKKAHPGALELLGFPPASLAVTPPQLDRTVVELPGELAFDFDGVQYRARGGPARRRLCGALRQGERHPRGEGFQARNGRPRARRVHAILEAPCFPPNDDAAAPSGCAFTGTAGQRRAVRADRIFGPDRHR